MPRPVFRPRAISLAVAAVIAAGAARAEEWRFCVGVVPASHETVITDIFASAADGARLERRLESWFRANKGRAATFQCPRGAAERLDAVNAQTTALQFNRQMGFAVSRLSTAEIATIAGGGT